MQPIGIFGGTFDPIHYGHLRTAFELWQELRLARGALPAHRQSAAPRRSCTRALSCGWRWCAPPSPASPAFVVDDREVRRTGVSYSVDTLTELRREYPDRSLCLLLGMDAFLGLPHWHRWREMLDLAHVVVAHRPGWKAPTHRPAGRGHGRPRHRQRPRSARARSPGASTCTPVTQLEISSTELRALIVAGRDPRYLVPEAVRQIILDDRVLCFAAGPDARNGRFQEN